MAGTMLGSTPLIAANTAPEYFQVHANLPAQASRPGNTGLPDHYPLVTRDGVVPVHALSDRGLYRQKRYAGGGSASPGSASDTIAVYHARTAERSVEEAPTTGASAPLALHDGPVTLATSSTTAKVINVAAALASR